MDQFKKVKLEELLREKGVDNAEELTDDIMKLYYDELAMSRKEKAREYGKQWYQAHKEQKKAYAREWDKTHREQRRESGKRHREKVKMKALMGEES